MMNLSDGEKLILIMLSEIYDHLKIKGETEPEFIRAAIFGGATWGLKWKYPGIFDAKDPPREVVSEVTDILAMWDIVEESYKALSKADKDRVEKEAGPLGKHVTFPGFDGNHETEHLGVAGFLTRHLDSFTRFKGRGLNSHAPLLDSYRRMYVVYKPMMGSIGPGTLTATQIAELMKARIHPSQRGKP